VNVAIGTRRLRLVVLGTSAVLAAAGCGASASSAGNPPGAASTVGTGAGLRHPPTPEQVAAELVAGARVPSGATEVMSAPTSSLATAPSEPRVSGRIERIRWWRIDRPLDEVYAAISGDQSPDLRSDGSSTTNGPALSDQVKAANFTFHRLPLSVNSASFSIAVAPLTETSSAIGAYAIVVEQPPRPASETVPSTVDQVRVAEAVGPAVDYAAPGPQVPPPVTVTGGQAQQIVMDFNELQVRPDSVQPCPMALRTRSATFSYDGHTLVATLGVCGAVNVSLDGQSLRALDPTPMFSHDVTSALAHQPTTSVRRVPGRH
jgi:hypothetical protein